MKLVQISCEIILKESNPVCESLCHSAGSHMCVCAQTGQLSRPKAVSVGVFLEPRCHLPPNSNNVVDQQLFTKRREDGTNLITPYSPVSPSLETVSI